MAINTTHVPNILALAQTPLPSFILMLLTNYYRWELQIHPPEPGSLACFCVWSTIKCEKCLTAWCFLSYQGVSEPLLNESTLRVQALQQTWYFILKEAFQYLPIPSPISTAALEIYQFFFFFFFFAGSGFSFLICSADVHACIFLKTWSICHARRTREGRTWCCAHFTT